MNIFKTFWRKKEKHEDKKSVKLGKTDDFKFKTSIEMRFGDLDMVGHVNNAVYFTYMEIGRSKYWQQAIKWNWQKTGVVIGQASIDYIAPIFLDDKIFMYIKTSRIGRTSFDLTYMIVKEMHGKEVICSKGMTVCVAFDYDAKKPTSIPALEREKMINFEQLTSTT